MPKRVPPKKRAAKAAKAPKPPWPWSFPDEKFNKNFGPVKKSTLHELPAIFSGPDSDLLWKAIAELGADDMTAMDVYNAVYQLACSMQALEARLVAASKKSHA